MMPLTESMFLDYLKALAQKVENGQQQYNWGSIQAENKKDGSVSVVLTYNLKKVE